jgi:hypothetical protein
MNIGQWASITAWLFSQHPVLWLNPDNILHVWTSLSFLSFWWAVKQWGIAFSKGFSYMTLSWSVRREINVVESSVENIQILRYPVNRWFTSWWQNFVQPDQCLTRRKLKKKRHILTEEKLDEIRQSEKVTSSISSSMRGVKIGCTRSNKTA